MQTKIVEATNGFNHGKFLVGGFDPQEMSYRSRVEGDFDEASLLLMPRWGTDHLFVMDLETGEGALFRPGGLVKADLDKHRVWVCPLFEPFLEWLYEQDRPLVLDDLPAVVNLPQAPGAVYGYRRPGPGGPDGS